LIGIQIRSRRFSNKPYAVKYDKNNALTRPRLILYVDCDKLMIINPRELIDLVNDYIRLYKREHLYIVIDEISNVKEWTRALKAVSEIVISNRCTLIVSGSCSFDINKVSETIAGRRGEEILFRKGLHTGPDIEFLPILFRDYVKTCDKSIKKILVNLDVLRVRSRIDILQGMLRGQNDKISKLRILQKETGESLKNF